ncbi:UNVERIFIED_CONTAM: EIN3-binding F-box protein 1 [Sesamum calycinum]|uniref:EIN3-binding F-box protein 1 n=1 Tax=Sesamum calycinum TaxID=2727403 RepID=A0AAW2N149_9LAMI
MPALVNIRGEFLMPYLWWVFVSSFGFDLFLVSWLLYGLKTGTFRFLDFVTVHITWNCLSGSLGDDDFYSEGGSLCSGDSGVVFSIGSHVEIYCPPRKRSRISGPYIVGRNLFEDKRPSIDVLPDECLFEIFRRLPGGRERSASACVSKRWLTVLSSVRSSEFNRSKIPQGQPETISVEKAVNNADEDIECDGYLTRCVEGKKATDVRLAAIAVGTSSRGGLGKLSIRGSNALRGISNFGLSAIARGCPSLRVLSLWNVPSIGDEGIYEIARECHSLEKLDLCQCPSISNSGLAAIAESCPNLTSLTIESCPSIGNESLQAIAKFCPKLQSITIKDCALVGDQGIASLLSSASTALTKVKLQALNITDYSVAVIGHYGKSITNLVLCGLQNGVTDLSLEALGRGCPNLKYMCLRKCCFVSDNGLVAFAKAAGSLESLQLEEVNRITQQGILTALSSCISKLKSVSMVKCMGIKDLSTEFPMLSPCESLRCLSIRSCPGFGSTSLAMVGKLCPQLHHLDLSGLCGITDAGLLPLLESCEAGLAKVNLSDCSNLTDEVVLALARQLPLLNDLDVSKCSITDSGVVALSHGSQHNLQILSFSGCSMISNESRPALEQLGRTLVGLNLQHCNSISSNTIESLTENLWRCDILS